MDNRLVYQEVQSGQHLNAAAVGALRYFENQRNVRWARNEAGPRPTEIFRFNDTEVGVEPTDTVSSLTSRWWGQREQEQKQAAFRRRVLEANPELDSLMPELGFATQVGLGNTLDWIVKFAAIADDSVVELLGEEIMDCFVNRGYIAHRPVTFGTMIREQEELRGNREAYGRHIVGLFMHDLSKGRELQRDFANAVRKYDSLLTAIH